jgi:hypothetical protein
MRPLVLILTAGLLPLAAGAVLGDEEVRAKGKKVAFQVHSGYSERADYARAQQAKDQQKGGLGIESYLAFTSQAAFDKAFIKTPPREDLNLFLPNAEDRRKRPNLLPRGAFDKKMVVVTTFRGSSVNTYKVEKVTADGETLYVQYQSSSAFASNDRIWSSPLILSVDKGPYTSVVFVQGTKKWGEATVPKDKKK